MRRLVFLLPLIGFIVVAAWVAVPLLTGDDPSELPSALIDRAAPEFALPALPGADEGFTSAHLGADVVLVNVFASWCVPCLAEHPILTRLATEEGVALFGINYKDATADATGWLEEHGNPYDRIGVDMEGRASIDWGVYGVPETFIVDRDGRIRYRHAGPITPSLANDTLLPLIRQLEAG